MSLYQVHSSRDAMPLLYGRGLLRRWQVRVDASDRLVARDFAPVVNEAQFKIDLAVSHTHTFHTNNAAQIGPCELPIITNIIHL